MHRGHHILVVDDDEDTRNSMAMVLELQGYGVVTAANGQEALERLRDADLPCLILLDLMMPVLDGWQFRDQQRQDPALAPIPVVVVSAHGALDEKAAALDAAAYLRKPIELDQLLNTVQRHC
jgi:CheY-like chemotaxis protein